MIAASVRTFDPSYSTLLI